MDELQTRQLVADAGRRLFAEGLAARTWGNISCRMDEAQCIITPSGLGYDRTTAEDTVVLNIADGTWRGTRNPSSERGVHLAAYRIFPDARFVIHTHQDYASALGLAGWEAIALTGAERARLGGLACAAYGLPGTKTLTDNVAAELSGGAHTVLMAHHGALIVARDAEEAFGRANALESMAKAVCMGQPGKAEGNSALLRRLTAEARRAFGHAASTDAPAVIGAAVLGRPLRAQLDDMAQMIGPRLVVVPPVAERVLAALKRYDAVLVRGAGAICRAENEEDLAALCRLTEKGCIAALHTRALHVPARLSLGDVYRMRRMYLQSYAKQIGG